MGVSTQNMHGAGATLEAILHGHIGAVNSVTFSPDGARALTGGIDGIIRTWAKVKRPMEASNSTSTLTPVVDKTHSDDEMTPDVSGITRRIPTAVICRVMSRCC